ncbi:DNA polymerase III subunit gamma/tau [Rhynchospora pubera]|uniref:DNA-directed DNA polymerase n=1 Tax=Rhynchospora pubera TaxID=906938 RepID=A0AAV8FB47_9POAL|nr:DNA polymerase III subunit gamma/tau [Rhynchospora pubera]
MSDPRRNSVDIPLTKTLVQLKRVRSLRDPSTYSLSKLATTLENANWDTNSINGVTLDLTKAANHHMNGGPTECENNKTTGHKTSYHRKANVVKIRGLNQNRPKLVHKARPRKSLDSSCVRGISNSAANQVEEVNSYEKLQPDIPGKCPSGKGTPSKKKLSYPNFLKASAAMSRVGSPCISVSEARTNGTDGTRVRSNDVAGSNFSGCGISYCWSVGSRYRDLNPYSDSEDLERPLLSTDGTGTEVTFKDITSFSGTPRNLSQKFRPKTFNDLIGLNVASQSLLYSSCKGKVAPIYLFHGPRGTGKTSTARIFAASLNCLSLEDQRPCGFCRECVLFQSGKSRDVKEIDGTKIDRSSKVKALVASASLVPYSSRFRVFIIDECHVLRDEAWSAILKSLDEPYRHSVYIMVTSDIEAVPRSYLSHCQKYHFPKIKPADIMYRLQRICVEEGLEFENDAIQLIAGKSNGSLRDAETMLDQLGLLGKQITVTLVNELNGSVSDDDLIELLDLALSSDTTNTVRKARELMSSSVDPLQLVSQLANLIMDILSGRCQSGLSDISKNFLGRYALAETGMKRLRHALKILSEAEKHLRTSKNQSTWVTVALLQFGSVESSLLESNDTQSRAGYCRDEWVSRDNLSSAICYACSHDKSNCSERRCRRLKLENIWRRAVGKCQSKSIKNFLRKEGYLSSVHVTEELAIAEVGFGHPDLLSKAEKIQNLISTSLQHELGCDVEVRLKLVSSLPASHDTKSKKQSFSLLSCSRRQQDLSESGLTDIDDPTKLVEPPFIKLGPASASEDDTQRAVTIKSTQSESDAMPKRFILQNEYNRCSSKAMSEDGQYGPHIKEPDFQPSCFARTRKLLRSDHAICLRMQNQNKVGLAVSKKEYEAYFYAYDPTYTDCYGSNSQATLSSREENLSMKNSRLGSMLCWRTPKYTI